MELWFQTVSEGNIVTGAGQENAEAGGNSQTGGDFGTAGGQTGGEAGDGGSSEAGGTETAGSQETNGGTGTAGGHEAGSTAGGGSETGTGGSSAGESGGSAGGSHESGTGTGTGGGSGAAGGQEAGNAADGGSETGTGGSSAVESGGSAGGSHESGNETGGGSGAAEGQEAGSTAGGDSGNGNGGSQTGENDHGSETGSGGTDSENSHEAGISGGSDGESHDGSSGPGEDQAEGDAEGESSAGEYVIGEDGETLFIVETEPETEYIASTPANADTNAGPGVISKTYTAAANALSKTAQSAKPALKSVGFSVLTACLIMVIGLQIAKVVRKTLNKTFGSMHMDDSLRSFLTSMIYALICGLTVFVALEKVGVSSGSIVAVLGSVGLAISLSLQDFLGNFAGGVIILFLKPFRSGDYIICGSDEGTVANTSLFYTTLRTIDNRQVILPNGNITKTTIVNVTAEPLRRLEIKVGISYQSDLKKAKAILQDMFEQHPCILHDRELQVFVSELEENDVLLVARGWIAAADYWATKWEMTEKLKLTYDEEGIEIPIKQMDINIRNNG